MADNVTLPGTGEVVASDDVGGVQFQRFKLDLGADGVSVPVVGAVPVSGTVGVSGSVAVTGTFWQATQPVSIAAPVAVTGTFWQATQPVSVASLPLPTGAATAANQATANASLGSIDGKLPALSGGRIPVVLPAGGGGLTDAELRASPVPMSLASVPLPTGAATEATLAALNAKVPAAGQAVMAASQPVVIASNQTAIPTVEAATVLIGAAAQTATVNNILSDPSGTASTPVENFRSASVQIVSTGTGGTFIFEQSNDDTNWRPLPVFNAELVTGVPITAAITASASQIIYTFPIRARFLRVRIATTITGGSIRAFSRLSTEPWTAAAQLVASNTAGNLLTQATIGPGTNAIGDVGVQYRTTSTGAASFANVNCPATPAVQTIKGTAGRLVLVALTNTAASARWLKVWNTAAGSITLGTTAALFEIGLPAGQPVLLKLEGGLSFGTAINIAITGGQGLTNNSAVTLGDVTGVIGFA